MEVPLPAGGRFWGSQTRPACPPGTPDTGCLLEGAVHGGDGSRGPLRPSEGVHGKELGAPTGLAVCRLCPWFQLRLCVQRPVAPRTRVCRTHTHSRPAPGVFPRSRGCSSKSQVPFGVPTSYGLSINEPEPPGCPLSLTECPPAATETGSRRQFLVREVTLTHAQRSVWGEEREDRVGPFLCQVVF